MALPVARTVNVHQATGMHQIHDHTKPRTLIACVLGARLCTTMNTTSSYCWVVWVDASYASRYHAVSSGHKSSHWVWANRFQPIHSFVKLS